MRIVIDSRAEGISLDRQMQRALEEYGKERKKAGERLAIIELEQVACYLDSMSTVKADVLKHIQNRIAILQKATES